MTAPRRPFFADPMFALGALSMLALLSLLAGVLGFIGRG
jgi:hypothetical protein